MPPQIEDILSRSGAFVKHSKMPRRLRSSTVPALEDDDSDPFLSTPVVEAVPPDWSIVAIQLTQARGRLLTIAPELRDEIWKYLVVDPEPIRIGKFYAYRLEPSPANVSSAKLMHGVLRLVHRQIDQDLMERGYFHRLNTLNFSNGTAMLAYLSKLNQRTTQMVTSVMFGLGSYRFPVRAVEKLALCKNLKNVGIECYADRLYARWTIWTGPRERHVILRSSDNHGMRILRGIESFTVRVRPGNEPSDLCPEALEKTARFVDDVMDEISQPRLEEEESST